MTRLVAAISFFSLGLIVAPAAWAQSAVVNHLTMNQWVQSSEGGALQGRVVLPKGDGQTEALEGVTVAISTRDGQVMRAKSNEKGEFTIPGVQTGVYALTARGKEVFACCAMHVISAESDLENRFPKVAEISVANVDYTVVNTAVIRYMPPNAKTADVSMASAQLERLASRVCGNDMFRVAQSEGGMKGRLHLAGAKGADLVGANLTNVFLFKDAMEIDRTLTDESGRFAFEIMQPGQYSLLAIGPGGVGLIGFELVDESTLTETAQTNANRGEQLVGIGDVHGGCCCPEFAMQIAPMPEMVHCVEEVIVEDVVASETIVDDCGLGCGVECEVVECCDFYDGFGGPMAGGGYYGGGGGGGYGGGGGGGGIGGGGIGALAGLGVIAAAAANNGNGGGGFILPPVVASPSVP